MLRTNAPSEASGCRGRPIDRNNDRFPTSAGIEFGNGKQSGARPRPNDVFTTGIANRKNTMSGGGAQDVNSKAYWDTIAPKYAELYDSKWSMLENKYACSIISEFTDIDEGSTVLDIGCASRSIYSTLPKLMHSNYVGLDSSPRMIAHCSERYSQHAAFIIADMDSMPIKTRSVDLALALFGTASYSNNPNIFIQELDRVLKNDGIAILSFLSRFSLTRVTSFRLNGIDRCKTRGDNVSSEGARAIFQTPNSACAALDKFGFSALSVLGEGILGGLLEWPSLWPVNHFISRVAPGLSYSFIVVAKRRTRRC